MTRSTSGAPGSRLVLGTAALAAEGGARARELLDAAFDLGVRAFDTAHAYGGGAPERILGAWIRDRGLSGQVTVIGKGCERQVSADAMRRELAESLDRLQVGCIDVYLLHRDDPAAPVGPLVEALHAETATGRIGRYGVSNWSHGRIAEAIAHAGANRLEPIRVSSPHFSLAVPSRPPWPGCVSIAGDGGAAARAYYARTQLEVLAWSPLAGGLFADPGDGAGPAPGRSELHDYLGEVSACTYGSSENLRRLERARSLGARRGATAAQIALAYVLCQPMNIAAAVRCGSARHLRECARAEDLELSPAERTWLETGREGG